MPPQSFAINAMQARKWGFEGSIHRNDGTQGYRFQLWDKEEAARNIPHSAVRPHCASCYIVHRATSSIMPHCALTMCREPTATVSCRMARHIASLCSGSTNCTEKSRRLSIDQEHIHRASVGLSQKVRTYLTLSSDGGELSGASTESIPSP